jgi:hypothetical protein
MAIVLKRSRPDSGRVCATVFALAFSLCQPAGAQERSAAPIVRLPVSRGDNLFTLAARYFARQGDYRKVQRLNRIVDPRRLQIGLPLLIPKDLLRREPVYARVHSFRGTVRIGQRMVAVGMLVSEGDLIETGQRSFITLTLPDDSSVVLPSQSAVRVQRLRRTVLGKHLERLFAIEQGRAGATVTPMNDPLSDFRFSTPTAVTSVRGTEFRVTYDAATRRTTGEVLDGAVGFEALQAAPKLVPAGYGIADELAAPVPLLPPPDLLGTEKDQSDEELHFTIKPLAGATRYHLQIGLDADFLEVIDEVTVASPEAVLPSLPNGHYFARVTGIDAHLLEGRPSTYAFVRRLNRISTSTEQSRVGRYRQYLFRWHAPDTVDATYRFQLSERDGAAPPLVDEIGLRETSFVVTDLPRGSYRWRVMTSETIDGRQVDKWSDYRELRIENAR